MIGKSKQNIMEYPLEKQYKNRTFHLNKRYRGKIIGERYSIIQIVQSIMDSSEILIHFNGPEDEYTNPTLMIDLKKISREMEIYYNVQSEYRRIFHDT